VPSRPREGSSTGIAVAEKVEAILASKGLTLYRASRQSIALYGRPSLSFLPHNLYYDLRSGSFRPSAHQIFALSRISGYRVADWLQVFGFDLEDITRLQILLPSKRTLVLDTSLTDPNVWIPWLRDRPLGSPVPSIAPLSRILELGPRQPIASVSQLDRYFVYAKIGGEDALAFPDLVPGSIVRVSPDVTADLMTKGNSAISDRLFLVEHSKGFFCCRIRILGGGVIVPFDSGLSYAQVELHCPQEARVWGAVDLEFRPLLRGEQPEVPKDMARRWKPQPLPALGNFGQLLKRTRTRMNLSVREAAAKSRTIAEVLKDSRYETSPSSLSDYELGDAPPRDFHKIITLCSIYGLQFESVMKQMGIDVAAAGTEAMPDRYVFRAEPGVGAKRSDAEVLGTRFLETLLLKASQVIPFFLRDSLGYFSGSRRVSLGDFFWVGGEDDALHPYLAEGLLVMVNRRRKTPLHRDSKPWWQQPLYIILMRDGSLLACCCAVENGLLVIHPYSRDFHHSAKYRLHQDAEVVGEIVAILRRLP